MRGESVIEGRRAKRAPSCRAANDSVRAYVILPPECERAMFARGANNNPERRRKGERARLTKRIVKQFRGG